MNVGQGKTFYLHRCGCTWPTPGGPLSGATTRWCESYDEALRELSFLATRAKVAKDGDGPRDDLYYSVHVRMEPGKNGWLHVLHVTQNDGTPPWERSYRL